MEVQGPDGIFGRLSDEVILMILKNLRSQDLFVMIKTCRRLRKLCLESSLWGEIQVVSDRREDVTFALSQILTSKTNKVVLKGNMSPRCKGYRPSLSHSAFFSMCTRGENLKEVHLINQVIDANYFKLHDLPESLKVLNLKGSKVINLSDKMHYMKDLYLRLPNLEELDLSDCRFIASHSLMAISKLPNLKKLSLKGCRQIGDCLAYVALSARFGFQNLKVLDVTNTKIGSSEFTTLSGVKTLEEFYFGQYDAFVDHQENYIVDFTLTRLLNMTNLRIIDMSGSSATDRTLQVLERLPNLERVEAHFTSLTHEAIERFHERRPSCAIHVVENPVHVAIRHNHFDIASIPFHIPDMRPEDGEPIIYVIQ